MWQYTIQECSAGKLPHAPKLICMVKARDFRMADNFRGTESEKALKINFRVVVTATSPEAWHCCTNDDVIDTSATIKVIPTEL